MSRGGASLAALEQLERISVAHAVHLDEFLRDAKDPVLRAGPLVRRAFLLNTSELLHQISECARQEPGAAEEFVDHLVETYSRCARSSSEPFFGRAVGVLLAGEEVN